MTYIVSSGTLNPTIPYHTPLAYIMAIVVVAAAAATAAAVVMLMTMMNVDDKHNHQH